MKCPYDPREMAGLPIGMFHCPVCGEMVLAGMEHPDYSLLESTMEPDWVAIIEEQKKSLEKILEEQRKDREEIEYLKACFEVLRDKTQALAIMVGDLQDRPGGSLRERVSTIEDHLMHMTWKDEILRSLPQKNSQNQSLPEKLNEELDRLEDFEDPGEPEHEVRARKVPAEEIDPAKSLRAEDHIE